MLQSNKKITGHKKKAAWNHFPTARVST